MGGFKRPQLSREKTNMSRTLLKVAGEQNDPLRVKVFPHDFVDKPLLPLILLQFSDKQYISEVG